MDNDFYPLKLINKKIKKNLKKRKEPSKNNNINIILIISLVIFNLFSFLFFSSQIYDLKKKVKLILSSNKEKEIGYNSTKAQKYVNNENFIESNKNLIESFIKEQNDFCDNPNKYYNKQIEDKIILRNVKINGISYEMYVFNDKNFITNEFQLYGAFEVKETINILNALKYYATKKNISNNKDIYMLDIGGNIGWYPSFLGRYGYSILTFEPFENNYYVLRKNYCLLNRNSNIIIITKGIDNEEKTCDYYMSLDNTGNGIVICNKDKFEDNKTFQKNSTVSLTKLSNFIPYLSDKNIALIKLDIEGAESKAIESGIELITKYHVPFIFIEFTPSFLKVHQTNPREFAQFFVDNGYKISLKGFIDGNYISVNELMLKAGYQINCYFIYKDIIESN